MGGLRTQAIHGFEALGVRPLFLILLRLVNTFCNDTDRREVPPQQISHFSECVVINPHRLMNSLIAGRLIGDDREQIFQARASGKAFSSSNLWVNRFLREQRLQLLRERISSQEHPCPQFFPYINSFPSTHELAVCTYCTRSI